MTQEDFMNNILGNAQRLCSQEGDAMISSKKLNAPTSKAQVDPESFGGSPVSSSQDAAWDRMFLSEAAYDNNGPAAPVQKQPQQRPITQKSVARSRVPDFIKESMLSNSIDTTALSDNPLDRMDLSRFQSAKPVPERQVVNETVAPMVNQPAQGVDYAIIRAIMKECIEEKFKEYGLTKGTGQLNEGTLKSIHLKGGTINLVDNSGNIYSAKLKKEGNLNEGKK